MKKKPNPNRYYANKGNYCNVPGCTKPARIKGKCPKHYALSRVEQAELTKTQSVKT